MKDRPLPTAVTDWSLFNDLVRVHQSVATDASSCDREMYEWWAQWNRLYFNETLRPLFIYTGNSDYGKYLGFCRYLPSREIMIQQQGIKSPIKGEHYGASVMRHSAFAGLSEMQYCVALMLLHEMIHQACFEAGVNPDHEGAPWATHCNVIGADLGLRLTFSEMKRGKAAKEKGQASEKRRNVWRPVSDALLPGTDRLATVEECRSFPWREDAAFIRANTVVLTEGKAVVQNGGEPVEILPKF